MITRADSNNQIRPDALQQREENASASPAEVAEYWNVHVQTIYRDIRKGALRAFRLPGGDIRIRWIDAKRYGRPFL